MRLILRESGELGVARMMLANTILQNVPSTVHTVYLEILAVIKFGDLPEAQECYVQFRT